MLPNAFKLLPLVALVALAPVAAHADDDLAPLIEHSHAYWAPVGKPLKLRAKVSSMTGRPVIAEVYVRPTGLPSFTAVRLQPLKGLTAVLQAEIPADLMEGVIDYYIEAYDADGNGPGLAGSAKEPLRIHTYNGDVAPPEPPKPPPPPVVAKPAPAPAPAAKPAPAAPAPAPAPAVVAAQEPQPSPEAEEAAETPESLPEGAVNPTEPEEAGPGLFENTPVWAWALVGGTVLAAAGAVVFQMQSAAIVGRDVPVTANGTTTHSLTQAEAAQANSAATLGAVLGGVAVGCAAGAAVGFLVEF